nr:interaptin [Leptinotarsa decemlineata]
MSFSKAKIQRFNEVKAYAPSPATYKPETKPKLKSSCQPHSNVPDYASVSETGSTQSVPCFRTPTIMKRKIKGPDHATKPKAQQKLFNEKSSEQEALREKIVECENKNAFIKDLSQQLEEITDEMSKLKSQKDRLELDKTDYEHAIENLNLKHEDELKRLRGVFENIMKELNEKKLKMTEEIALIREDYEEFIKGNLKELMELRDHCDKFPKLFKESSEEYIRLIKFKEAQLETKEKELLAFEQSCIEMQNQHSVEIQRLKKEHHLEIQDIEFEMLKVMSELQSEKEASSNKIRLMEDKVHREISELKNSFEVEREQLILRSREELKKVEQHFKESNLITEDELKGKLTKVETNWKNKLTTQEKEAEAILKECQAISEYNIIQCEIEKNKIKTDLLQSTETLQSVQEKYNQTLRSYEELLTLYETSKNKFDGAVKELSDKNEALRKELEVKNEEMAQIAKERSTYEITIKNSQVTIEVLKRRLIHSDQDVEQLKQELADCEGKILEFEQKCLQLTSDLKETQTFNDELEMQYESAIKLNRTEIDKMSIELLSKVDEYKREVQRYSEKLEYEKKLKNEIMQQLHDAHDMINRLKVDLDNVETLHSQYKFEVEQSQNELEDYHMREMDWNIVKDKLEHTVEQLQELLEVKDLETSELKRKIAHLEEKSESYLHYSEYYQRKLKEYEEEQLETENIHRKYIEMSGKYDELSQKFEDLEANKVQHQCNFEQLAKQAAESKHWEEEFVRLKEAYETLFKKYENLEKEKKYSKNKVEEPNTRSRLEKAEAENDVLVNRVKHLENELKEVSQKYAELAGHQNSKQKIKHLIDLKAKNEELAQSNVDLDLKLLTHIKTIEKLKKENSDLKKLVKKTKLSKEDKENFGSPNRSLNSSRIESPFRDRN